MNINENKLNPDIYVSEIERRTNINLTKYEKVRLLGERTAQITQGAKPMIQGVDGMNPRDIAQLELEVKMIPIKIIRPLPNGKKEVWKLDELNLKREYIKYGFTGGIVDKGDIEDKNKEFQKGGHITGFKRNVPIKIKGKNKSKSKEQGKIKGKMKSKSKGNGKR